MKKGLNLSKFKKVSEDQHFANLIHEDGHNLMIAKGALSAIHRKQLENLDVHNYAEGGEVDPEAEDYVPDEGLTNAMTQAQSMNLDYSYPNAKQVGGSGSSQPSMTPESDSEPEEESTREPAQLPGGIAHTEGTGQEPGSNVQATPTPQSSEVTYDMGKGGNQATLVNPGDAPKEGDYHTATFDNPLQPGVNAPKSESMGFEQGLDIMGNGPKKVAEEEAKLPTAQDIINGNRAKDMALTQAYATGKANPDTVMSPEGRSKGNAWLGVLVAGLGQAIGAGRVKTNVALDQLNKNTENEIKLQRMSDEKNLNLWKMNRAVLGTDLAANLATQNQLNIGNEFKLKKLAAESNNAHVQAQTAAIIQKMQVENEERNRKLALLASTADSPDPATRIPLLIPDPGHQKAVAEQADHAKKIVKIAQPLFDAFDLAAQDTHGLRGPFPGGTAGQKTFQGLLGVTIPAAEGGTNNKSLREGLEHNFTPSFGDSKDTLKRKRAAFGQYLRSVGGSSLAQSYGLDFSKFPATNTSNIGLSGGPGAEKAEIKRQNGHVYRLNRSTGKYE